MSVRLSCPSCNHAFALSAVPPHGRATCPRCGDVFPVRGGVEEVPGDAPAPPEPFLKPIPPVRPPTWTRPSPIC